MELKITIESDSITVSAGYPNTDLTADELIETFAGLMVAYGFLEETVISAMEEVVYQKRPERE